MLKIRNKLFETNSSSSDRYDDYDYGPSHSHARQHIHICLNWADDASDERVDEIIDNLYQIEEDIFDCLKDCMEDADDFEVYYTSDRDIEITADVTAKVIITDPGYEGDRYCPPEGPDFEFKYTGFPGKREVCPLRDKVKDDIMKLFAKQGWTEILGIDSLYGEDIDEGEFYDNLD